MIWMFVSLSNSNANPQKVILVGWAFGKWLGNEDKALIKEISVLIKEIWQSSLALSIIQGHSEKSVTRRRMLIWPCWLHNLGFPVPKLWGINFCLFFINFFCKPPHLWCFVIEACLNRIINIYISWVTKWCYEMDFRKLEVQIHSFCQLRWLQ